LSIEIVAVTFDAQAAEKVPIAFSQTVSGARPIGLNGTFVAMADDANAIWWNPAGISQLDKLLFTSMYANLHNVDGLSISSLALANPTSIGALGIGITYLRANDIPITDANGNIIENSAQYESVLTLSYANSLLNKIHLGASIRHLRSGQIVDSSGFSLDFGLLANPIRRFYFGAMLQQMASYLSVGDAKRGEKEEKQTMPRNIKIAAAFDMGKLSVGVGLDNLLSSYREVSAGCELLPCDYLALRTGLRTGIRKATNLSFSTGMGFKLKKIQLDYAYMNQLSLASTHLVSISIFN